MKTLKTIIYLLLILQSSSIIFADADPANPAKTQKPCGFPDNMNCFENRQIADAEMVNANFKALLETNKKLIKILCSFHPNLEICPQTTNIFRNSLGMTFTRIPAGSFIMGSPEDEPLRANDETQHQVTISKDFFMQTTEVTQGQWNVIMGSNPSNFYSCGDNCPVENVSWNDIQVFIKKMNTRNEGTYRLPTEAEWEYSARAGTQTPFSFGLCLTSNQANFDGNHPFSECPKSDFRGTTIPVASFDPNAWGIYDMHGNVTEWCNDRYGQFYSDSVTDPIGPTTGSTHVVRGGRWQGGAYLCRSARRAKVTPDYLHIDLGFRLVLDSSSDQKSQ